MPRTSLIVLSGVLSRCRSGSREPDRFPRAYDLNVVVGHYVLTPIVIGLLVWLGLDPARRARGSLQPHDEEDRETAEAR